MEMKEVAKYKTLWKMNSTSEPLFVTGVNGNPLKKFTIPKIRRTSGKVYLSRCYTNTREYSFIHDTLNECRLDVSRDLQSSWQFGDTKLIHNEGLEKNFTSKRSEMRESGRHGRELEEHFCFLALPQKDVTEIYHSGLSTKASSLRILGNPRLGIYIFRHVDVALNYAHNRSITVESIIIFKVLFGKVRKIQPSLDKSKVSLDPSPNFDCHMSRNTPSLKDTIELQAYSSAVSMKHVTEIKSEKSTFKHARTMRSHSESENEIEPDSSDSLKRSHISPKQVETQRSLPLMNLKDSEDETDLTDTSFATSEGFTRQQGNISSTKKRNINFSAAETKSEKKNCSLAIFDQKSVDGTVSKDQEMPPQKFLKNLSDTTEKSCPSDIKPGTDASLLLNASEPIFRFVSDSHANLEMNDTDFELQDNEILNSSINSTCTSSPEPMHIQNKIPVVQINKARPAKTESKEKYMKDTLNFNTIPVEASENITLSVNQTVEYSLSEQQNSKVLTQNAATYLNEIPQSMCTPEYDFVSGYSFETSYPYYSWCVYRYSSSNDSSITQTYQGITSYEVQPPPSGILTAATSNSQNTHSHLLCSQYFEYFAGEPQANDFMPVSDYFPPQMPVYNFQQPVFSQYTPHQLFTAYPCSPDSGALLEVPWTYDPCHQEPFQPGH